MSDLLPITLEDQLACVEREIELRRRVYLNLIGKRQMTAKRADWEIACMEAVLKTLQRCKRAQRE